MPLPKINTPTFEVTIPSLQKKVKCRPFLIKEEKLLLIALESAKTEEDTIKSSKLIADAIHNILGNCILDKTINPFDLANFDIEYMFLKLRTKSVGEIVDVKYINRGCTDEKEKGEEGYCVQTLKINLDSIEIDKKELTDRKIMLTDEIGIKMKYPTTTTFFNMMDKGTDEFSSSMNIISKCIECIFDSEEVYPINEYKEEEIKEFLENLSGDQLKKITEFFSNLPKLRKEVKYTCKKCNKPLDIKLEGIQDFFA